MLDFRIFHVNDGATMAESIVRKFTGDPYNLSVECHDFQRRHPSSLSRSESPTTSPERSTSFPELSTTPDSPTKPYSSSPRNLNIHPKIAVLLVTPGMLSYLARMRENDRPSLTKLFTSVQDPVALRFEVTEAEVKSQLDVTFDGIGLIWNHLEVQTSSLSFRQCTISLISMLEEDNEAMPIPTLKTVYLLPDNPVLAGDRVYIRLDNNTSIKGDATTLDIKFENGNRVTANQIADSLFEFEAPDISELSLSLEVFSGDNQQSLGTDTLRYRDKFQLLAVVLRDLFEPSEFMYQAVRLGEVFPQVLDAGETERFKLSDESYHGTDSQRMFIEWEKSIHRGLATSDAIIQELPTLLHLSAKHNLCEMTQSLLTHPCAIGALSTPNAEGFIPEELAAIHGHKELSNMLKNAHRSSQSDKDGDNSDTYVEPGEIFQSPDASLELTIGDQNSPSCNRLVDEPDGQCLRGNTACQLDCNPNRHECNDKPTLGYTEPRKKSPYPSAVSSSKLQTGLIKTCINSLSNASVQSGDKQASWKTIGGPIQPESAIHNLPFQKCTDARKTHFEKFRPKVSPKPASNESIKSKCQKYGGEYVTKQTSQNQMKLPPRSRSTKFSENKSLTGLNEEMTYCNIATTQATLPVLDPPPLIPCRRPSLQELPTFQQLTQTNAPLLGAKRGTHPTRQSADAEKPLATLPVLGIPLPIPSRRPSEPSLPTYTQLTQKNTTSLGDEWGTHSTGHSADSAFSEQPSQWYSKVDEALDCMSENDDAIYSEVNDMEKTWYTQTMTEWRDKSNIPEVNPRHFKSRSSPPSTTKELSNSTQADQHPRPSSQPLSCSATRSPKSTSGHKNGNILTRVKGKVLLPRVGIQK